MHEIVRVLVFDADGVLIEPWGFADALQRDHGISRLMTEDFFRGPFEKCLRGIVDLEEILPPYLERWGWRDSTAAFIRFWMEADNRPSSDGLAAYRKIRRTQDLCCLASNQERLRARYIREDMSFGDYFDRLYFSCELGYTKPSREYYQKVQADLGVSPDQIFFWDDSPAHVKAAASLGWNAYVYEGPHSVVRAA